MTVLRSREIHSTPKLPSKNPSTPEPATPSRIYEPSTRSSPSSLPDTPLMTPDSEPTLRRSLRLASKSAPSDGSVQTLTQKATGSRKRKTALRGGVVESQVDDEGNMFDKMIEPDVYCDLSVVLGLRSGKKVAKRKTECNSSGDDSVIEIEGERDGEPMGSSVKGRTEMGPSVKSRKGKRKRKGKLANEVLIVNVKEDSVEDLIAKQESVVDLTDDVVKISEDAVVHVNLEEKMSINESGSLMGRRKYCQQVKVERAEEGGIAVIEESAKSQSPNASGVSRGKRKYNSEIKVERGEDGCADVVEELEKSSKANETGASRGRRKFSREENGKRSEEEGGGGAVDEFERNPAAEESGTSRGRKRYIREEKGKGKLVNHDGSMWTGKNAFNLEPEVKELVDGLAKSVLLEDGKQDTIGSSKLPESRMEQFRGIARQNASRFAHFEVRGEVEDHADVEMPLVEGEGQNGEDWPGPFSTAMKIIRDRANRLSSQQGASTSEKAKPVTIAWVPKINQTSKHSKGLVPSLQELCMRILVKNANAIVSLEHVPDALRHRLCQLLCDSRRMNGHILGLLVRGSPTEICIRDCSWLTEEEFVKYFEGCETNNLTVLQLDQCGRCMPDYTLVAALARSPGSLPVLTTFSISGACRLSDVGLSSLVSAAPALKSLNLSQCSLLTSASIDTLADSVGRTLQELYLNDCDSIDPMLSLPAMKKLEHLEVLSLSGIQTISDDFMREFIVALGHNMKELVLADCVKLTDSSLKVIAETCSQLCALHLGNLRKLTDSALGFLANGCQKINTLKLCGNAFSDEAIAAFVETSGEPLKELSLNNIKKVGHNTALFLARRSRKLIGLDLSWCRSMTDEAVGLIVDSCLSLRVLKLFGCSQITNVFLDGHSNSEVEIIGLKMSPVLEHVGVPELQECPLRYSSATSSI